MTDENDWRGVSGTVLKSGTIFAQGHLAALRDWMYHTQQAARYIEAGEYVNAEERIKVAINDIKPYLPDTRRIMARTYCELARVLYLSPAIRGPNLWRGGPLGP